MKKFQVFVSAFLGGVLVAVFSLSGLLLREEHPVAASMLFGVMLLAVLISLFPISQPMMIEFSIPISSFHDYNIRRAVRSQSVWKPVRK